MSTRKSQQSEATRADLVAAARRLFAEQGYAGTGTEEIVQAAGMTRGALYHHFKDKRALFQAAFEAVEQDLGPRVAAAMKPNNDAWANFLAGSSAFLDACLEPDVQQIVLIDGPSVLGWDDWRRLEEQYALALVAGGLTNLMAGGFIREQPVQPLAHLLLAALNEAGLVIARSPDVRAARKEVGATVQTLLEGLRIQGEHSP